jgi:transcriptional regulator GlxA family with amidase domain
MLKIDAIFTSMVCKQVLFFVLIGCMVSCKNAATNQVEAPPVLPTRQLNVAFVVVNGVYNSELIAPMDVFHHTVFHTEKGMRVFTLAVQKDTITTFEGLRLLPDYVMTDSVPFIDVLVVPSAEHSMDTDLQNEQLVSFVREKGKQASYIFSLCDGAFILAKAGLLDTYECTTFPTDIGKFKKQFPFLKVHEKVTV